MNREANVLEHEQGNTTLENVLGGGGGTMEAEELVGRNTVRRELDRPEFILSNSLPLQRSQTFESNGREGLDARRVRRRNSNDILRETPRKRLSLRTGARELRLPL